MTAEIVIMNKTAIALADSGEIAHSMVDREGAAVTLLDAPANQIKMLMNRNAIINGTEIRRILFMSLPPHIGTNNR